MLTQIQHEKYKFLTLKSKNMKITEKIKIVFLFAISTVMASTTQAQGKGFGQLGVRLAYGFKL